MDESKKEPTLDDIVEQKIFEYLENCLSIEVEQNSYRGTVYIRLSLVNPKTNIVKEISGGCFSIDDQSSLSN